MKESYKMYRNQWRHKYCGGSGANLRSANRNAMEPANSQIRATWIENSYQTLAISDEINCYSYYI